MRSRGRRALGSLVAFMIFVVFVVMILVPFLLFYMSVQTRTGAVDVASRQAEDLSRMADVSVYTVFGLLVVENHGAVPVKLQYVVYSDGTVESIGTVAARGDLYLYNGSLASIPAVNEDGFLVEPGQTAAINISGASTPVRAMYISPSGMVPVGEGAMLVGLAGKTLVGPDWVWVEFPEPFPETPIVVASVYSYNAGGSATVYAAVARIRDVTRTGFWIRLEDPNQTHVPEEVVWLAVLPGYWRFPGFEIYAVLARNITGSTLSSIEFPFVPTAVVHTIVSYNQDWVESRGADQNNLSDSVFVFRIEGFNTTARDTSTPEDVALVAFRGWLPGFVEVTRLSGVTPTPTTYTYTTTMATPWALHSVDTWYGPEPVHTRIYYIDNSLVQVMLEEPPGTTDGHVDESVSLVVFPPGPEARLYVSTG